MGFGEVLHPRKLGCGWQERDDNLWNTEFGRKMKRWGERMQLGLM